MSDSDGTCEYVLDPDDPETWGGEEEEDCQIEEDVLNPDDVWTCPHDAEENEELCIFHLPLAEKNDRDAVKAFRDTLNEVSDSDDPEVRDRKLQFYNATFGEFELSENLPDIALEDGRLTMAYADIAGKVNWSSVLFDISSISFRSAQFGGDADFNGVEFRGDADFNGVEFRGDADFRFAKFAYDTDFRGVGVGDDADFSGAAFGGDADFRFAQFAGDADFGGAPFFGSANFWNAEFGGDTSFRRAKFDGDAYFREVEFGGDTDFRGVEFGGDVDFGGAPFGGDPDLGGEPFGGDASSGGAEFGGDTSFRFAQFSGDAFFKGAEFEGEVNFRNLNLDRTQFDNSDLTDATFIGTNFRGASFESALLSRATLFGVDLRGAKLSGAVLGDVRIDEDTKFLGHPSDDGNTSPHTLASIRSQPKCVYDPDYEEDNRHADVDKAKSVYRALEELGGKHARPRLQARAFVRRQDLQKQDYWDDATADDASLEEQVIAGARWSRARVARATLLYGESPWRVIAWSLSIIFSFALLYPLGGWMKADEASEPLSYSQISANLLSDPLGWLGGFSNVLADSLYYSTLTYTALGFGDFKPVNLGRLLTSIETGLGAVMLALLVFILGRRAAR